MKKFNALSMALVLFLSILTCPLSKQDSQAAAKMRLNYSKRTVTVGKEFCVKAFFDEFKYDDDRAVWKISNKKVVGFEEADHTGDDMDFVAKKAGTATITCRIRGTKIKKSCKIKVVKSGKAKITVDDPYLDIEVGEWEDIEAKLVGGSYSNRGLSFKSSNTKIVKVKNGLAYGVKIGRAKITISAKANKNIKKVIHVIVEYDD